jgi:hypothetical protein
MRRESVFAQLFLLLLLLLLAVTATAAATAASVLYFELIKSI